MAYGRLGRVGRGSSEARGSESYSIPDFDGSFQVAFDEGLETVIEGLMKAENGILALGYEIEEMEPALTDRGMLPQYLADMFVQDGLSQVVWELEQVRMKINEAMQYLQSADSEMEKVKEQELDAETTIAVGIEDYQQENETNEQMEEYIRMRQ